MSHYKPYPAYKDSRVEWLGQVPEHWEVTPLKYEAEFVNGAAFKPEQWSENGTPIIRIENLNGSLNFNCFDGEMDARYHVDQGDLLFGWSGNRGTSFGPFIWPHEGRHYLNQHIFRICNFKFDESWFYWSLKAVTAHVEDQAHGIIGMVHITKGDLGAIKIATPVLAEQQAIAAHLDRETARIDALVAKKTRFIELLREKRQALITHAVTKGLDPNVKMKDSGVEWLGVVPEHWEVAPMKYVCDLLKDGTHLPPPRTDDGVPLLSVRNIIDGHFTLRDDDSTISYQDYMELCKAFTPQEGDVLLAVVGATLGKTALIPSALGQFHIQRSLAIFRPYHGRMDSRWLHLIFQSSLFQSLLWEHAGYSAQPGIYLGTLAGFSIPQPPLNEQVQMLAYLSERTARLDSLIKTTECSIELLKERCSALITAAVTGQIDLREAV